MSDLQNTAREILENQVNEKSNPKLAEANKHLIKALDSLGSNFDKGTPFDKAAKAIAKAIALTK